MWNSVCISINFKDDEWMLAINGDTNKTFLKNYNRPLVGKFSENSSTPMVMRLGHYYFDNKPIIGKIVDFHMWDRWVFSYFKVETVFNIIEKASNKFYCLEF